MIKREYTYIRACMHACIHIFLTLHCITLHYTTLHYNTLHYTHCSTLHYITLITTLHIPLTSSARPMPGRKFWKKATIGGKWPIGMLLRCKSNEVLKLCSASTNEQMVVEMPMKGHERIHAQLTERINDPLS